MSPRWLRERRRLRLRALEAMMRPPIIVRTLQPQAPVTPPGGGAGVHAVPVSMSLEISPPARAVIAELRRHEARRR